MVEILKQGEREIAYITGDVDHHTAVRIRENIDISIMKNRPKQLKLDFRGVSFMDSSGIGLVMGRYKAMSAINGTVCVVNVPENIKKVMILAGLDKIVKIDK